MWPFTKKEKQSPKISTIDGIYVWDKKYKYWNSIEGIEGLFTIVEINPFPEDYINISESVKDLINLNSQKCLKILEAEGIKSSTYRISTVAIEKKI